MSPEPEIAEIESPQFCPWCGAPAIYRPEKHTPLWKELADENDVPAPEVVQEVMHTEAYAAGCPGCRRVSHVIGHHAQP